VRRNGRSSPAWQKPTAKPFWFSIRVPYVDDLLSPTLNVLVLDEGSFLSRVPLPVCGPSRHPGVHSNPAIWCWLLHIWCGWPCRPVSHIRADPLPAFWHLSCYPSTLLNAHACH
jgi:hypothetical protein